MLITTKETIGICLFELPEKDHAVIQRVIAFGASQGKHYSLQSDVTCSEIIITLNEAELPNNTAVHIRIGDSDLPYDILLQRPLLVTRVMRAIDDAAQLLKSRLVITAENPDITTESSSKLSTTTELGIVVQEIPVPAVVPENGTESAETYRYTALVVDDSAAIRKQLEIELRHANISAEFAETGEEALEKSAHKQYDLVFLDVIMPGIDGYEVCRKMRSSKAMKKTPIIMLSGKTSPLDEVQGVIAGASTYLTKPVQHEQFQQTLKRVSKWLTNFAR
ncbi:Response regulator receiver domain-containing protein [Thiothrix caldifontis]|uniref:Response regulator receiver domain-containing protein n=1 Tax=Thiothrix caldifontis TaxID=525918 RepID=A0A1H4GRD9_9GAMM|nr:response regulator [Thiothrix caldifontis]SEB12153.1 Response regulator receiver domain-containing protein [Thiothrix caldifontis]